jgi:hypothetical protein
MYKGRPRKSLDATADAKAVRARLKDKDLEGWQRQRLQAAQLGLAGVFSLPQIAAEVGAGTRTVGSSFAALRRGGVEGLLMRKPKGRGPASWLDERTAAQFKAELDKGRWRRAQDARRWLENKLGRKLTLIVTYKYLGKCEARLTRDAEASSLFRPEVKLRSLVAEAACRARRTPRKTPQRSKPSALNSARISTGSGSPWRPACICG